MNFVFTSEPSEYFLCLFPLVVDHKPGRGLREENHGDEGDHRKEAANEADKAPVEDGSEAVDKGDAHTDAQRPARPKQSPTLCVRDLDQVDLGHRGHDPDPLEDPAQVKHPDPLPSQTNCHPARQEGGAEDHQGRPPPELAGQHPGHHGPEQLANVAEGRDPARLVTGQAHLVPQLGQENRGESQDGP